MNVISLIGYHIKQNYSTVKKNAKELCNVNYVCLS